MAVPGHDERDYEFAKKFNLPILRVLESNEELPFVGEGQLVNSDFLNGMTKTKAIKAATEHLEQKGLAKNKLIINFAIGFLVDNAIGVSLFPLFVTKTVSLKAFPKVNSPWASPKSLITSLPKKVSHL